MRKLIATLAVVLMNLSVLAQMKSEMEKLNSMENQTKEKIQFRSDGLSLTGNLYKPKKKF
jgi:hypothetical protein